MRWLVEVTPIGKQDAQSYCVDAESWQKALESARKLRNEASGMSGFSIELLENGYRAVDPMARLRYVVKHAPPGTALTPSEEPAPNTVPGPPPTADIPSDARTVPNLGADDSGPNAAASAAPAASAVPAAPSSSPNSKKSPPRASVQMKKPVQKQVKIGGAVAEEVNLRQPDSRQDPRMDPPQAVAQVVAPAPVSSASAIASLDRESVLEVEIERSEPPAKLAQTLQNVQAQQNAQNAQPIAGPGGPTRASAPPPAMAPAGSPQTLPPDALEIVRSDPPPAPPVGSPIAGLPPVEVLASRAQEPDAKSPIVYREFAFAVAPGTPEALAERLLAGQLELVKRHIAGYAVRKFVNLAVFDVKFSGKPPVPPLVTLTWKDWSGAPVVAYPRQGKKASIIPPGTTTAKSPTQPPPANIKKASVPPPGAAVPAPLNTEPMIPVAPAVPTFTAPAGPTYTAPAPTHQQTSQPVPLQPTPPVPIVQQKAPAPQVAAQAAPQPVAQQMQQIVPQPVNMISQPPPQMPPPQMAPQPVQASTSPVASVAADPFAKPAAAPGAEAPRSQGAPRSGRISTPPPMRPVGLSSSKFQRGRVSGDELISALFEAMHDLHFLRDALEGGDFCLALANDMLPSRAGLVHVYDVNKRNFIVACASGAGTDALLGKRIADSDPLLLGAMRGRKSLVVADAKTGDAAATERYRMLGGSQSVIVTPVMFGARALASIELINPLDGQPFTAEEGHAMNYIAEQFAEFIGSHGLVLETDKILAHRAATAAHG